MPRELHFVQSYSADFDNRSVDVTIRTNGGTYHAVEILTYWNDGTTDREVRKCFSRSKATTIAIYMTTKTYL